MPGMSGLELLPKAKAARPDVPVIMITAYGDAETKRKALESGAEALLTKPIDFVSCAARSKCGSSGPHDRPNPGRRRRAGPGGLILQKFRHQIRDGAVSFLFARDGVEALAALQANGDIEWWSPTSTCRGWTG